MKLLDRFYLEVPCPRCSYEIDVQFLSIRLEAVEFCPNCKVIVRLVDEDASGHSAQESFLRSLRELRQGMEQLGMSLTINL